MRRLAVNLACYLRIGGIVSFAANLRLRGSWLLLEGGQDEVDGAPDGGLDQCVHAAEMIAIGQAVDKGWLLWGRGWSDEGDISPQETSGERQHARDHLLAIHLEPDPVKGLFVDLKRLELLCHRS